MSELPRTDDLPRSDDGFDPERVEEAFASFAERVRELESVALELRAELRELRAERRPAPYGDDEDWPDDGFGAAGRAPAPDWVASVQPPVLRPLAVPRVALEGVFLLAVALLAGLADLEPTWIVLVMAAAWALVALSEWISAAKRARWHLDEIAPSVVPECDAAAESTGPWSMPVVESTAVEAADVSESRTVIAMLPDEPAADTDEAIEGEDEPEAEQESPARRFRLWRRRRTADAPDPWER